MRDPFKTMRARSRKKLTRVALSALTDVWSALLTPAIPAKRKAVKSQKSGKHKEALTAQGGKLAPLAKKAVSPVTPRLKAVVPRGAAFENGTHVSEFGTRAYMLFVPAAAKTAPLLLPMIVMLHGCGQTPEDFAKGTGMNALAEEFGFLVLYPAQSREAHPGRCWNWFRTRDQDRGAGEPALIADLTRRITADRTIDPARVYIAGLSAGASAALIAATAYPEIFAAVGVHSGLAVGAAHDKASAARAMQIGNPGRRHDTAVPTIIFHGDADTVVRPRNGRFVAMRALEPYDNLAKSEKNGRVPGGLAYSRTTHRVGKGRAYVDSWVVAGSGHAWSGGDAGGSHTDPNGPDASREMVRFFLRHRTGKPRRPRP